MTGTSHRTEHPLNPYLMGCIQQLNELLRAFSRDQRHYDSHLGHAVGELLLIRSQPLGLMQGHERFLEECLQQWAVGSCSSLMQQSSTATPGLPKPHADFKFAVKPHHMRTTK